MTNYAALSDTELNQLDQNITMVLDGFDKLIEGESPEWYDDLAYELFKIHQEITKREEHALVTHPKRSTR